MKACINEIRGDELAQIANVMAKLREGDGVSYGVKLMRTDFYVGNGRVRVTVSRGRSKYNDLSIKSIETKW